jgi:hypothetical protein
MQVPINFRSAELLTSSLCQTVVDAVCQAGCDADDTLPKLREASRFAHELARFLDALSEGISAEIPANPPSIASVTPLVRVNGQSVADELRDWTPGGAA